MSNHNYVGNDFEVPDGRAKVTGEAKYADDYQFDNLLHAKTVKSPYAHARVRNIDTSEAESMSGVQAVITHEDVPDATIGQPVLAEEPLTFGYPVAAVAADDEYTAAAAVEAIDVEWEVLDHVVDPVETLKPGSPNARPEGNVPTGEAGGESAEGQGGGEAAADTIKWNDADFSGDFPENPGDFTMEWNWGEVSDGFENADTVYEDTVKAQPQPTNPMEPRSTVAEWGTDGHVTIWGSSQSISLTHTGVAGIIGKPPTEVTFISNFCGGGFGSKGTAYPQMGVPAFLSREVNRPVKIRGTRREEFHWGNGRATFIARTRVGLDSEGTITALEIDAIGDAGAYSSDALSTLSSGFNSLTQCWQPETLRFRGIGVFTNTPKRWPQRGPGQNQAALAIAQVIDEAAKQAGLDPLDVCLRNAPENRDPAGADRLPMTSAYLGEAYELAADAIGYEEKRARSGTREGSKVYGVGMASSSHQSGYIGFDGLIVVHTDGTVEVRQGAGNLGTESFAAVARMAADTMNADWENVEVSWGSSDKSSFTLGQFSSNTTFTEGLANVKAAETAVQYLKELAAEELGGTAEAYTVENHEVVHGQSGESITFAEAAQAAVDAGGKYSAEEIPEQYQESLVPLTIAAASDAVGQGLVAFGKTTGEDLDGFVTSFAGAISEVSVDLETGKITVEEMANYNDSGTVVHPESFEAQVEGGATQGIGYTLYEQYRHDDGTGIPVNTDLYKSKPPSIHDYVSGDLHVGAVGEPDPFGPYGAKGVGEPPYGAASGAVAAAVKDALGTTFNEFPVTPDKVLEKVRAGEVDI
ncbi:xanthine dehydrogenase family protein molybdopterin-binding subunit [Halobellus limi]|uniref:Xanthine dehydrogenase family protein molybdopterin-binding subunit n=1 Tax=Halobellus limi TaxID=699433 RepID=A0A1H5U4E4_9EURY|nr:xanthine dehydrogenase family protein molybdopterin-binding subunit [Halobellus limi]QCC47146.1 xanthine dehydrogenase family protein molybdopterin-binding subunit [Halobellus limi]SEF69890.1 xanthine dehydrogenase molybdenum-binding subunit [Halobellus limi]